MEFTSHIWGRSIYTTLLEKAGSRIFQFLNYFALINFPVSFSPLLSLLSLLQRTLFLWTVQSHTSSSEKGSCDTPFYINLLWIFFEVATSKQCPSSTSHNTTCEFPTFNNEIGAVKTSPPSYVLGHVLIVTRYFLVLSRNRYSQSYMYIYWYSKSLKYMPFNYFPNFFSLLHLYKWYIEACRSLPTWGNNHQIIL